MLCSFYDIIVLEQVLNNIVLLWSLKNLNTGHVFYNKYNALRNMWNVWSLGCIQGHFPGQ